MVVAEIGVDTDKFPSTGQLASWAGMCPGNNESAGKHLSRKTRKANRYLRAALTEAAHAACRKKGCYLAAQGQRLAARRGKKKAIVAVGHSILVIVYHLFKHPDSIYQDLGMHYLENRNRDATERYLVK